MLTDTECRKAVCPAGRPRHRLTDGAGLYLEIAPSGSKRWFWKFYPDGKESRLALGSYPDISLKAARQARDDARKTRQSGVNPAQQRKVDKLARTINNATSFESVARECHANKSGGWGETYAAKWIRGLEKDLFPALGSLPIASIKAPLLLAALRKVEARGVLETAHTLRMRAGQVFKYAVQTGRCDSDPAAALSGALKPVNVSHMAAVLEPSKVRDLMLDIDSYSGHLTTRVALGLSALLFQRPGNMRALEWGWIDLDAAMLAIPSADMKRRKHQKINGRPHLVPLAHQALKLLLELQPLTGHGKYLFPSLLTGERCMSENTVRNALRRMDYSNDEMTAHGFRAMARTLIAEKLTGVAQDVIEAQLAHVKSGPLSGAYDRAEYLDQRRTMMQAWADYLDSLRTGGTVVQFKAA